ncbi:hypothetical protein B484DRAFT_407693 [Ochromonadaceae sp. CCMP2298]|nr:hypothetical protein B484DRAFT_407693 [Ochromonadaceae sp. CCMP2298]
MKMQISCTTFKEPVSSDCDECSDIAEIAPLLSSTSRIISARIVALLCALRFELLQDMLGAAAYELGLELPHLLGASALAIGRLMLLARGVWWQVQRQRAAAAKLAERRCVWAMERAVLVGLFESLGGRGWNDKTRWCSEEPVHRWKGVKLDHSTGRVNKIILAENRLENRLQGVIPQEIGRLTSLIELDLRCNQIRGPLPV